MSESVPNDRLEAMDDPEAGLLDNGQNDTSKRRWFGRRQKPKQGGKRSGTGARSAVSDANEAQQGDRWVPEETANIFSHLFFNYCTPLMRKGLLKPLEADDTWDVPRKHQASSTSERFQDVMRKTQSAQYPQGRVGRALIRAYGFPFLVAGIIKVFHDCVAFTQPLILSRLLASLAATTAQTEVSPNGFVTDHLAGAEASFSNAMFTGALAVNGAFDSGANDHHHLTVGASNGLIDDAKSWVERYPKAVGLLWAVALFMAALCQTLLVNRYFHILNRITVWIKASLISTLYRKALKISSAERQELGVGPIVNYMSNDASKLWVLPQYMHVLWSGPFQIAICLTLLTSFLGWEPALAGTVVCLLLIPFSTIMGRIAAKIRAKVVAKTDARVRLVSEVVTGIKAIKLYAWEEPYADRIAQLRQAEQAQIRRTLMLDAVNSVMFAAGPILISLAAFTTYTMLGRTLTAEIAFPSLVLLNNLRFPIFMLPRQIFNVINATVALKRLHGFFQREEMEGLPAPQAPAPGKPVISVSNASYAWCANNPVMLHDVTMAVAPGQLVVVIGSVGCGKSSLLAALLGEMHRVKGDAELSGTIGYTCQDPWIQNLSLRDNILMGEPFDESKYARIIEACALQPDLDLLPAADATEIGEKGVNLSGGQKHRVALARACYASADVYLLDDPLSAVDAHVGRHIFDKAICGLLKGSTRVLVTHQMQYVPQADWVVILENGRVSRQGTYTDLAAQGVDWAMYEIEHKEEQGTADKEDDEAAQRRKSTDVKDGDRIGRRASSDAKNSDRGVRRTSSDGSAGKQGGASQARGFTRVVSAGVKDAPRVSLDKQGGQRQLGDGHAADAKNGKGNGARGGAGGEEEVVEEGTEEGENGEQNPLLSNDAEQSDAKASKTERGRLVKSQQRSIGQVRKSVYYEYLKSWGPCFILPVTMIVMGLIDRGSTAAQSWWMSYWSDAPIRIQDQEVSRGEPLGYEDAQAMVNSFWYLKIYGALGLAAVLLAFIKQVALISGVINSGRKLHNQLLSKVLRLPMSFFDSQPTGRLLNRFAKDIEAVDIQVMWSFQSALMCIMMVGYALLMVAIADYYILLAIPFLYFAYRRTQRMYLATSRELKRLDSLAFSPIFGNFSEIINGLQTVRAFRKQSSFMANNLRIIDNSNKFTWPISVVNRWLSVRLELMSNSIVLLAAVLVSSVAPTQPGIAGLAITSALSMTGLMTWMIRQTTELEVNMNAVERLLEYLPLPEEAPAVIEGRRPPASWPQSGQITVHKLWFRYRPELDPVLRGVSFALQGGQKLGVCGRTGSGKSTLMMAIYRIVEPSAGRIEIDGLNIATIGLRDLRSRLSLVPQDPVIFSGTIKSNLDPWNAITDEDQLWQVLEHTGLRVAVSEMGGLDTDIVEGGSNLSVGQKQLLCMARALLRNSRILILDEATSNVDNINDSLIQTTIRSAFRDCTVLTIAHRIHTIMDSDKILLLDAGEVEEFDAPSRLMKNPKSAFCGLVREAQSQGK